jgi:hypothetical protein
LLGGQQSRQHYVLAHGKRGMNVFSRHHAGRERRLEFTDLRALVDTSTTSVARDADILHSTKRTTGSPELVPPGYGDLDSLDVGR